MSEIRQRFHAIVEGRVQGVSFRFYTVQFARNLEVTGWVRNLPDGSVEVVAEGPREHLDGLLEYLHEGPPDAHVRRVTVEWNTPTGEFSAFSISYASTENVG